MSQTVEEIRRAVADVLQVTFVEPVRGGRPQPRSWPRGLGTVGLVCMVVLGLLGLAILGSGWLRQVDQLVQSQSSGQSVPASSVPLLLVAVVLAFALAATAALHTSWWLRICLILLTGEAVLFFGAIHFTEAIAIVPAAGGFAALVVFIVVRSFGRHAWWEFAVVLTLLMVAMFGPWLTPHEFAWGVDARLTAIEGSLMSLQPLILPAVMVASSAPAQIVVTGAQATADRPVGTGLFRAGLGIAVVALAVSIGFAIASGKLTGTALLTSVVMLVPTIGLIAVLLRRARVASPPRPEEYPQVWGDWIYPLATGMCIVLVPILVLGAAESAASVFGATSLADVLNQVWYLFVENQSGVWWRAVVGMIALIVAWRFSRRGRLTEAVLLATFFTATLIDLFGLVPGLDWIQRRSAEVTGFLVAAVALVVAVSLQLAGRLGRVRAVGLMTVLLLAVLYPHRQLLSDPISAALQIAPTALLVFGLAWRAVTEAQVTYADTRNYPQSTRILLFLANLMLATAGIAWVALTRGTGTTADISGWAVIGDSYLAEPLFTVGLISGLWLMIRPAANAAAGGAQPNAAVAREEISR